MGAGFKKARAAAKTTRAKAPNFSTPERAKLNPLILRAAKASMLWNCAEEVYDSTELSDPEFSDVCNTATVARDAALAAGAALTKALRTLRKGATAKPRTLTDSTRHALSRLRLTNSRGLKVGGRNGDALVEAGYAEHLGLGVYRVTDAGRMVRL